MECDHIQPIPMSRGPFLRPTWSKRIPKCTSASKEPKCLSAELFCVPISWLLLTLGLYFPPPQIEYQITGKDKNEIEIINVVV